jgi:hypothetical protein
LLLVDAAVVQNAVTSASVASSPSSVFALTPVCALSGADVVAADLKAKLYNLDLSLIDNTQPQFPVAVSSLSSLSSKTLIVDPSSAVAPVSVNEAAFQLKCDWTVAKC